MDKSYENSTKQNDSLYTKFIICPAILFYFYNFGKIVDDILNV